MDNGRRRYLAYMLRLWEAGSDGNLDWRASLESPHTGERHGFANLEALFGFLEEKMDDQPQRKEQPSESNERCVTKLAKSSHKLDKEELDDEEPYFIPTL